MQPIDQATQTVFADLNQRTLDAAFDEAFPENGSFSRSTVKGRDYWYYDGYDPLTGKKSRKYVGPTSDEAISSRVEAFDRNKTALKARLEAVRMLRAAGLPVPDAMTGALVDKIARAGFFRLRGVLIGTIAFQTYPGLVGARPERYLQTGDIDLAQDHGISIAIDDNMSPVLEKIAQIDPSFRAVSNMTDGRKTTSYVNARGYKIEFLVPNRGSDDHSGKPSTMPALAGTAAQPLRFLDFLIRHPVRSVLLYGGGVPVTVPAPTRYAIHKLIVATRRNDREKAAKDLGQASFLIEALVGLNGFELIEAWMEAWQRGPTWRHALTLGKTRLTAEIGGMLDEAAARWAPQFGVSSDDIGLAGMPVQLAGKPVTPS
jgi:hypothetical protein